MEEENCPSPSISQSVTQVYAGSLVKFIAHWTNPIIATYAKELAAIIKIFIIFSY